MKKSVVLIIGIVLCLGVLATNQVNAQSINQADMDRDLKVASNVLKSMLQGDRGMLFFGSRNIEANYMEGYGVIFTLPRNNVFRVATAPVVAGRAIADSRSDEKDKAKDKVKAAERADRVVIAQNVRTTGFSSIEGSDEEFADKAKTFLVDYALLIHQLKPTDRVSVKQKSEHNEFIFTYNSKAIGDTNHDQPKNGNIAVEAKVSDLKALREGKINREEAMKRISVVEEEEVAVEEDVRLFGNIIKTVYEPNTSSTYYLNDRPQVERIKDFGAIYTIKFYSSSPMGFGDNRTHHIPTLNLRDVPQADRDKKIEELYPKFVQEFKENLIEYGRTVRSLKDSEKIIIKAKLTSCEGCGIPESVEFAIAVKDLKAYSKGNMTRDAAASKVAVKEIGKQ